MATYRHKPTIVTAIRLRQVVELPNLPEHTHRAEVGDFGVVDINGQLYLVPDETFRQLYDPNDDEAVADFNAIFVK